MYACAPHIDCLVSLQLLVPCALLVISFQRFAFDGVDGSLVPPADQASV